MKLFKLVNKTNKSFYPESFNEYNTVFHFDQRITKLYTMESAMSSLIPIDPKSIIVDDGKLSLIGDIKTNLDVFNDYMTNTTPIEDLDESLDMWTAIMKANFCEGEQGLSYLKFNNFIDKCDYKTLLTLSIAACSAPCSKFLLEKFDIKNAEIFLKDIMDLEDISFVEAIVPHMSDDFVNNIDIPKITAKHRYADVRKYLNNRRMELYAKNQDHTVVLKTA